MDTQPIISSIKLNPSHSSFCWNQHTSSSPPPPSQLPPSQFSGGRYCVPRTLLTLRWPPWHNLHTWTTRDTRAKRKCWERKMRNIDTIGEKMRQTWEIWGKFGKSTEKFQHFSLHTLTLLGAWGVRGRRWVIWCRWIVAVIYDFRKYVCMYGWFHGAGRRRKYAGRGKQARKSIVFALCSFYNGNQYFWKASHKLYTRSNEKLFILFPPDDCWELGILKLKS